MVPLARKPGWIALGSALIFNLLLLSLSTTQRGQAGPIRGWLLDALVPGEKLVDRGFQGVRGVWQGYFALVGVRDENVKLHAENEQLRMQIQQQEEGVREAERLRGLLGLRGTGIGKLLAARVIGRESRALQTVTIDK